VSDRLLGLEGGVAIVTGASRGIGFAIAVARVERSASADLLEFHST